MTEADSNELDELLCWLGLVWGENAQLPSLTTLVGALLKASRDGSITKKKNGDIHIVLRKG